MESYEGPNKEKPIPIPRIAKYLIRKYTPKYGEESGTLSELVQHLARDTIEVQKLWDLAYKDEVKRFKYLARQTGEALQNDKELAQVLIDIAPSRMFMRNSEIDTRIRIAVEREYGYAIKAVPLNLGYDVRFGTTVTSGSSIHIQVEQVPVLNAQVDRK